ncbi:MAG: NAD(+)/NADH kinase [Actinomycetota bacterium]|nr:NAD(+)/NADH kinase [Actinomycetota bacterium]
MAGLILVNPRSGDGSSAEELRALFSGHEVVECAPDEMPKRAEQAVRASVDFVAVAGGDGTIRCVSEILAEGHVPLLPVPAGTRNHFARELGMATLEAASEAAAGGQRQNVDLGEVNDCRFVNNSSVGAYPAIVVTREEHEKWLSKRLANLLAIWLQLRHGHRFSVRVDGKRYRAWMVFVGNGLYGKGLWSLAARESLQDNVLDFRLVRADLPLARCRVALALLTGRLERSPLFVHGQYQELELELDAESVDVAVDGEVEKMKPPLRYRSLAGALEVVVPPAEAPAKIAER